MSKQDEEKEGAEEEMKTKRTGSVKRYAIYLRCSSDDQAHRDYSTIDTQREVNEQYIRDKGGITVQVYSDEGRSGTNLKRPGWESLLEDAEARKFDAVCVTYMSRLGRGDTYTVAEYLLKQAGVSVEMVKEQFTDDLAGFINKQMTRFVDGMYVENVRQWTKTKMEQMAAKGYVCGGQERFGYRKEIIQEAMTRGDKDPPKRLVPDPEEAEIVRQAFVLFANTRSLATVRNSLNEVTTQHWNTDRVKYLLRNEVYLGVLVHGEWRNEAAHPAIVERELWQEVNDLLSGRQRVYPARTGPKYAFYLRGRVHCPHCGCLYTPYPAKSGTILYYACLRGMKKQSACPVMRINADALHHTILREIEHAARHRTVMHRLIAQSGGWQTPDEPLQQRRSQLTKRKQFVALQIGNLTTAIAQGGNLRSLLSTLERLEKEQTEVLQALERVEREIRQATIKRPTAEQVQSVWSQVVALWPELTEEERETVLVSVVQRVEVNEKNLVHLQLSPIADARGSKFELIQNWERGSDSN